MKRKIQPKPIWVSVKVERGFISDAKVFESFKLAKRTEAKWQSRLNPDYDETAIIKTRVIPAGG